MKQFRRWYQKYALIIFWVAAISVGLTALYLYRLGSIPSGMSAKEILVANGQYGWHGLFHSLLYAPLNLVRSTIFFVVGHHGQFLTRLPNAIFGMMTVLGFAWLLWLWHGTRTAILGTVLFASSAWTLHISRVANNDVMYLWAMVVLLVSNAALHRHSKQLLVVYGVLFSWVALLFVPGMLWLLAVNIFWQRKAVLQTLQVADSVWRRIGLGLVAIIPIGLLLASLIHSGGWLLWLGLPAHFPNPITVVRNFFGIVYHLYIHGPLMPEVWLGRLPILDILALVFSLIGLYFYATNFGAGRSRMLASFFFLSLLLISLGGPVSISLIVPLMYGLVATGMAFLLREWLRVFPLNPFARTIGIGLIVAAVALSSLYNVRAYFVAWPHNPTTQSIYRYHRS